jgi:hypothetical protein
VTSGPTSSALLVWLLLDNRVGDNNQLLALAKALGFPFEAKQMRFNALRRVPFLNHDGLAVVARDARDLIRPPWPDLVIVTGYGGVAVARYIRRQSGGRTRLVHIGNPRGKIDDFDLQITTPQYPRRAKNLLELPFPIGHPAREAQPTADELHWLDDFPRPRRLVAVGGPARHWELDHRALKNAVATLRTKEPKASLLVATSHRTRPATRGLLAGMLTGAEQVLVEHFPRFAVLLSRCDEIYVTADSVSMISEALLTGKRVGLIPIRRSLLGRISHWLAEVMLGRATLPNFPNFWKRLDEHGLGGTVEHPVAAEVEDTVGQAAQAVREVLAGKSVER